MPGASCGLRPLEALEADPGALERGIIIHRALERFVADYPDALPDRCRAALLDLGVQQFEELSHRPQVMALWWPRFVQVARWVVAQERARRPGLRRDARRRSRASSSCERAGRHVPAQRARRSPRATPRRRRHGDRLQDRRSCPSAPRCSAGLAPQLPLEAAMVEAGRVRGAWRRRAVAELLFWQLKGDEDGRRGAARPPAMRPPSSPPRRSRGCGA